MTDQIEYFKCPACLGLGIKGKWEVNSTDYVWGFKRVGLHCIYNECIKCGGKGYLDWIENIIPKQYITRAGMVKTHVIMSRYYPLIKEVHFWVQIIPEFFAFIKLWKKWRKKE